MGRTGIKMLMYRETEQITKDFITRVRIFKRYFFLTGKIIVAEQDEDGTRYITI